MVERGQVHQLDDAAEVTIAGAVIELVHLATLYHDDVMDEAEVRRDTSRDAVANR
ncbi:hypothetical protein MAHJHV59_50000 [Mycobacterium avium subsp. hominissuis]